MKTFYMSFMGQVDRMSKLEKGCKVQIENYKHNGSIHRVWRKNTILNTTSTHIVGVNDQTEVIESDGQTWVTSEPGIFYFVKEKWFNIIGLLKYDGVHFYCN